MRLVCRRVDGGGRAGLLCAASSALPVRGLLRPALLLLTPRSAAKAEAARRRLPNCAFLNSGLREEALPAEPTYQVRRGGGRRGWVAGRGACQLCGPPSAASCPCRCATLNPPPTLNPAHPVPPRPPPQLVMTHDAIHDMAHPLPVMRAVRRALAPAGCWVIGDMNGLSR